QLKCGFRTRRVSARCECWCGTAVLHPVDELVLVLPRALWRRCRSRGRHLRERRSWERRALARWTDLPVTQRTSWCSMRWSPPSPFYGVDAPRDRCYASTGTKRRQEETMNQSMTIGIDLAKHVFFIAALDGSGKPPRRKKLGRHEVLSFLANHPGAIVGMEACSGAHHWAREIRALGHGVQLLPAQHVKAYLRGQKNDYNDALAIAEAVQHGRIRCV